MKVSFADPFFYDIFYIETEFKMANFIPPLQINIAGNKCGGCCKRTSVRGEEAPLHYVVILHDGKSFGAVSQSKLDKKREQEIARMVFGELQRHLKNNYGCEWNDLPEHIRPKSLEHVPSVAQIKTVEATAMGYAEGFKKASSRSSNINTPILRKSPDPDVAFPTYDSSK